MTRAVSLPLLLLLAGCAGERPRDCTLAPAPAEWVETRLTVADARIALPPLPLRRIGPVAGRLEGWHGEGFQVLATVSVDTPDVAGAACMLRVGGESIPLHRVVRRPRPPSADSVHGGRVSILLPDRRTLTLEIGAAGRARYESLATVLGTVRIEK